MSTALASEALKARARQIRGEFEIALAGMLADAVQRPADDPDAHLAAALSVATWSVAFVRSWAAMSRNGDEVAGGRAFLRLVDQGMSAASAAVAQTPYA